MNKEKTPTQKPRRQGEIDQVRLMKDSRKLVEYSKAIVSLLNEGKDISRENVRKRIKGLI